MDAELAALRSKLACVQAESSATRPRAVNDRNVVEVLRLLQSRQLVDVIYTEDGGELLTWRRLEREIELEVASRGGRMELCDLPGLLNVSISNIETAVAALCAAHGPARFRVHVGEILTAAFDARVGLEVREQLRDRGFCAVGELTRRLRLPHDQVMPLLRQLLERREDSVFAQATLDSQAMYTADFVVRQRRRLILALAACENPVKVSDVATRCGVYQPLMPAVIRETAKGGLLPGTFEGNDLGTTFVPDLYAADTAAAVDGFYRSNLYVTFKVVAANGISAPQQYLIQRYNVSREGATGNAGSSARGASGGGRGGRGGKHRAAGVAGSSNGATAGGGTASLSLGAADGPCPLYGHVLRDGMVADKLLRSLEPHLQELIAPSGGLAEGAALDVKDFFPAFVDSDADRAILVDRLRVLFPALETACERCQTSVLVRRATWTALRPAVVGVAAGELRNNRKLNPFARPGVPQSISRRLLLLLSRTLYFAPDEIAVETSLLPAIVRLWEPRICEVYDGVRLELKQQRNDLGAAQVKAFAEREAERLWPSLLFAMRATEQLQSRLEGVDGALPALEVLCSHIGSTLVVPLVRVAILERVADNPMLRERLLPCVDTTRSSTGSQFSAGLAPATDAATLPDQGDNVHGQHGGAATVSAMLQLLPKTDRQAMEPIVALLPDPGASDGGIRTPPQVGLAVEKVKAASTANDVRLCLHPLGRKVERASANNLRSDMLTLAVSCPLEVTDAGDADAAAVAAVLQDAAATCTAWFVSTFAVSQPIRDMPAQLAALQVFARAPASRTPAGHTAPPEVIRPLLLRSLETLAGGHTSAAREALGRLQQAIAKSLGHDDDS